MATAILMLLFCSATEPGGQGPGVTAHETPSEKAELQYDTPPKPTRLTKPKYPAAALDSKIEGTVIVEILISAKGEVVEARVIQSVPELDDAALQCVYKWRFKPARKAGKPVATIANAPIIFRVK